MRDLEFSGYWEGEAVYSCDCCGKDVSFPFDSEDIDSKAHRKELRERLGWITTKVDGEWHDFCCEACRNKYIRDTTKMKEENIMSKDYSLSLRGEAFNSLCADFDTTLRDVLAGMIETEQNTGEINIKVKITLTDDSAPDYTVAGGHQTREVTKPKFDHTVAYVIQRKEKKSGSFSGNFELVFDKASGQYFYRDIDNGQTTLFDGDGDSADFANTHYDVVDEGPQRASCGP